MNRFLTGLLGLTFSFVTVSAEAQLVRVGPAGGVRVRAPFVSVDVLPFGLGTSVRAPFTSVNTRAYALGYGGYYRPGYRAPLYYAPVQPVYSVPVYEVYPAPVPLYDGATRSVPGGRSVYAVPGQQNGFGDDPGLGSVASPGNLVQQLRRAAISLSESLANRRDDGDIWLEYLAPGKIIAAIDGNEPMDSLGDLLRNYEGVTGNPSLRSIQVASGFNQTYRLLQQLVNTRESTGTAASDTATRPARSILEPTPAAPIKPAISDSTGDEGTDGPSTTEDLPIPVPLPDSE